MRLTKRERGTEPIASIPEEAKSIRTSAIWLAEGHGPAALDQPL
jgi:hypothetical protein